MPTAKRNSSPDPDRMRAHAGEAAALLKAVSNENRLMVLCALAHGELSVGELLERVDLSQSALSQHLAVLRHGGLVTTRRESQTIYYALTDSRARQLIGHLHEMYCPI